jgi:hypothetical protein
MTPRTALAPLLLLTLAACGDVGELAGLRGSGVSATVARDVPAFTGVELSCHCALRLRAQASQSVSITGDDNIVPTIETEVRDGTLHIRATRAYREKIHLTLNIEVPELARLAFSGAGEIDLAGLRGDKLDLTVSGAGSVLAEGRVRELDMRLSGAGSISAKKLEAEIVRATLSGAGSIDTYASQQLDATASGVGSITYLGNPTQVSTRMSGIGKITKE